VHYLLNAKRGCFVETLEFANFKEAFRSLIIEDEEYVLVRHTLDLGEETGFHYHPEADEWLVINHGNFVAKLGNEEREFNLKRRVTAVHFPGGQKHSLVALSRFSYFVLRDRKDATVYCEEEAVF